MPSKLNKSVRMQSYIFIIINLQLCLITSKTNQNSNILTRLCLVPRRICRERRRWQSVTGDASARHYPLAFLCHLSVLRRAPPAHPAPPVTAPQTYPHGHHWLLAGTLDVTRHRSQDRCNSEKLYHCSGERLRGSQNDWDDLFFLFLCCSAVFKVIKSFSAWLSLLLKGHQ